MTREHLAVLIGGIIVLILRTGDLLLRWVAKKLGVEELPDKVQPPFIPPPKEMPNESD